MEDQPGGSSSSYDSCGSYRAVQLIMPPPPSQNENGNANGTSGIENPSSVRNLKDILKFTTQMTEVAAENEANGIIDLTLAEEKKKFLTNVLSTMSVNVQEEMNNSINILLDTKKHVEEHEYAFDIIEEYIDNIDYANDFQKLGGFQIFIPGLNSEHKSVRCKTAELIATLVQHNVYCQEKFFEHPTYIRLLMSLVESDHEMEVRIKALHAISSLVRHNVSVFWKFIDLEGINLVVNALKSSNDKLKVKAAFLIYSTCHMGNDIADMYVENGVVEIICSIIVKMEKSLTDHHHELFLSSLNQLLRMSPTRVKEICSSVENFKEALLSLQNSYPNDSTFQDEKDQILWLMETLTL